MSYSSSMARIYYFIRVFAGVILIPVGLIITPLPIPIGLILIFFGVTLIAHDSSYLKKQILKLRKRYPTLSDRLKKLESLSFFWLREVLRNTDPLTKKDKSD